MVRGTGRREDGKTIESRLSISNRRPSLPVFASSRSISAVVLALLLCGCGAGRDVSTESRDVRGVDPGAAPAAAAKDAYEYVAKRPLGTVALAEGRGLSKEISQAATDRVADAMQRCGAALAAKGKWVRGAGRVVALIGPDGNLSGLQVKIAPGADVAANAILCFIAPIKSLTFPPADGDGGAVQRGIALEAAWGA